ncbi:MAG TPA: hypothetical protein PKH77_01745 [Anaerolineae bacterium]|nr:hypothetical protein [Anaerolineae bacterium]
MKVGNSEVILHVYANGRGFVIAPVRQDAAGEWCEYQPVQRVSLALGYSVTQRLTRVVRKVQAQSGNGGAPGDLWDGDQGRWWTHRLLTVKVITSADGITLSDLGAAQCWQSGRPLRLSTK